jgi:hypothetical protein
MQRIGLAAGRDTRLSPSAPYSSLVINPPVIVLRLRHLGRRWDRVE